MRLVAARGHRIAVMLVVSFALTVASFIAARVVSERQAGGIREAATRVRGALPADDVLADVRSELSRVDALVDSLTERGVTPAEVDLVERELAAARGRLDERWRTYRSLPVFPGERELATGAEAKLVEADASVARVLQRARSGDAPGAEDEARGRARVAIARTDELVRATADLNRAVARDASEMIVSHRDASRQWGFFLDGLSAMLAAIAAYAVIRVVRRFRELMNERVAELETFAARVAHDIRSPLGAVGFALELAKGRPGLDEKTTEILARGSRTLQRLGTLVDGLLVFAASGRPPLGDRGTTSRR